MSMEQFNEIKEILKKYKTPDNWLGTRVTASFEAEMVKCIKSYLKTGEPEDISAFKLIFRFIYNTDMDDSATGLEFLYRSMNDLLAASMTDKSWKWIKDNCFKYDDFFFETVLRRFKDKKEILPILESINPHEVNFYSHRKKYYIAEYHRLIDSPDYESILDELIGEDKDSDLIRLKMNLLSERGEKRAAFELGKDVLVLESAGMLDGIEKEEYLLENVMKGRGNQRGLWNKLYEISGDKYLPVLLESPKHCETANWTLYEQERYEELVERILSGWIYNDSWGQITPDCQSKHYAFQGYKKLQGLYPEQYADVEIEYSVFMMNKNQVRKSYKISAQTLARIAKLNETCREKVCEAVQHQIEEHPKRTAMIEEFKAAWLI